ncbi:MAG: putative major facilitator superfamily transporter [Ilumatobacteraceae bacterium]|nr:putative major facilitator superfamily transporter [Ilumatobacteraceae bacterium]
MSGQRVLTRVLAAGSDEATLAADPRDDFIAEREVAPGRFEQDAGPLETYSRTLEPDGGIVRETITYHLAIPWFGWLFALPVRSALRNPRPPGMPLPWWSPPDRLTPRQARMLGLLAAASLSAAFANTVFTQTVNFAADSFGIDKTGQGVGGVIVRLGVIIAVPFAVLADRLGRRRMIVLTAWLAPLFCALGAASPSFWVLVATQSIGRPLGLALALLITVAATEEMPRSSRAYALSVLAMASGLGAGVAVMALRLADLGSNGWRLVYLISLLWFLVAWDLQRGLPETERFANHLAASADATTVANPKLDRARFALICVVAVASNMFVAPASFFQNRYLDDVRHYSGGGIALFTITTATPAALGLVAGGKLADAVGRRVLLVVCLPLSTLFLVGAFSIGGPVMWAGAFLGGITAGLAYPAFNVYRTELFPTGNRGRANGLITAVSLAGSSIGLIVAGYLLDRNWSYGQVMALMGVGQLIAAVVAFIAYPETAHLTLEALNPEDVVDEAGPRAS